MTPGGHVLIVTGASRGIGAATARLAADAGYDVCVNFRQDQTSAATVADAVRARGQRAITVGADVSREADCIRLFDECAVQLGPVTALVNNAGVLEPQMRVETMSAERVARVFATNVIGTILCAREAVRRMSRARGGGGGAIVNVSSVAARLGAPNEYVDYAASKGAVDTFTVGLAKEVAPDGIRVNAVLPGLIYTEMHASGGEPGRVDRLKVHVPMQRGGQPDEVARTILWLLSDEASFVTGSLVEVAGGR